MRGYMKLYLLNFSHEVMNINGINNDEYIIKQDIVESVLSFKDGTILRCKVNKYIRISEYNKLIDI